MSKVGMLLIVHQTFMPPSTVCCAGDTPNPTMAGMVGTLILGRTVDDPKFSYQILEATAAMLERP